MRRWWAVGVCWFVCVASLPGCGPSVKREELGEVIFEVPKPPQGNQATPPAEKVIQPTS